MRLRRKPKNGSEAMTEVVVTETDQAALVMSSAAERLRALDTEMISAFIEWATAQGRCRESGLVVEIEMAEPMRMAYQTWRLAAVASEAPTSMDVKSSPIVGAGEVGAGHLHGWPTRMATPW